MPTISLRIDESTHRALDEVSSGREVTISDLIREAIAPFIGAGPKNRDEPASLSRIHRLELSALYEIRAGLAVDEDERNMFVKHKEIVDEGFTYEYGDLFLDQDEEMPHADARLLFDILDMFRLAQYSIDQLGSGELDKETLQDLTFVGFDFNDRRERKLANYTQFLTNSDRYTEFSDLFREGERGNSHMQMLPIYERMLEVFQATQQDRRPGRGPLTMTQLVAIAAATAYPR